MLINISYINMCKLRTKKGMRERGVGGVGVCGCSFGEPLKRQETCQTSLYIQTCAYK